MANNIQLVSEMTAIVDEVYRQAAVTTVLEAPSDLVRYSGGKSFKIADMALDGLGDYSRANGYPVGDVSLSWKEYTFTNDRGKRFVVDRMDNEESFGIVASRLNGDFTRDYMAPEVDAYRFAKIANNAGTTVAAALTKATIEDAVQEALVTLQEKGVPSSRLILFTTARVRQGLQQGIDRVVMNGETGISTTINTYEGVPIVNVPNDRFYTAITLNTGLPTGSGETAKAAEFGYEKSTTGKDINFILMDRSASVNITKLNMLKLFTPDENQKLDAWQWDYRLYHESFVFNNKKTGIYLHTKTA